MKKSAVNKYLFFQDIKRSFPVWVSMSFIYVVSYIPSLLGEYVIESTSVYLGSVNMFAAIADYLLVLMVFGFMNNTRSANFFFSLPIKRGNLFLTKVLACVTVTFVPALLAGLITIIGRTGDQLPLYLLIELLLAHITYLGTALFCMVLIGQSVAFAAISTIFQFTAYGVNTLINTLLRGSIYGYNGSNTPSIVDFLSPVFDNRHVFIDNSDGQYIWSAGLYIAMAVGGLVLGILAFVAFKKRKAESAGDIVVFKFLQPVFKYCVAFCSSLLLSLLLMSAFRFPGEAITLRSLPVVCVLLALSAAVGYFITEMLIQKKVNVFKQSAKGCVVVSAVIVAAMCLIEFDVFKVETRVPDINNISRVMLSIGTDYEDPGNIESVVALHEFLISQKSNAEPPNAWSYDQSNETIVHVPTGLGTTEPVIRYGYNDKYYGTSVVTPYYDRYFETRYPSGIRITYFLDNGKTLTRTYSTYSLFNNEEATLKMGELSYPLAHTYEYAFAQIFGRGYHRDIRDSILTARVDKGLISANLNESQASELYDAILADMREMNIGVDEYAPLTAEQPATLMKDKIVFMYEYEIPIGPYSMSSDAKVDYDKQTIKEDWTTIILDTRAKNTLALLDKWGIDVS